MADVLYLTTAVLSSAAELRTYNHKTARYKASKVRLKQLEKPYVLSVYLFSMCDLTTTFFSCGHVKSRDVLTRACANPSTCLKNYKEANDPMPCGDTACLTPPSS
jgi:hypothetical protein